MSQRARLNANPRLLAAILYISTTPSLSVNAFSTSSSSLNRPSQTIASLPRHQQPPTTQLHLSKIIDAEVIPDDELDANLNNANPASTLIEYSQNQDPDWKSMPIAFCDTESNTYMDCNLAFYVKDPLAANLEGAEYALGVPSEIPIVVALELDDDAAKNNNEEGEDASVINLTKVIPINPDDNSEGSVMRDEEKEEIFQMAARALQEEFGQNIRMKKTPRVLTIEGDLEGAIGDWREVLLGSVGSGEKDSKVSLDEVSDLYDDDEDDEEDYFDKIMRRDLGEDYEKLVDDDDEMDEALLKLFEDPGSLDDTDLDDLMEDINTKETKIKDSSYDKLVQQLQPSAALKLLNFLGPGGKEYTILRPLRPILLIGKEDPDDYTRRILLTEEERERILPRLESACREGLEKAGFFLAGSGDES